MIFKICSEKEVQMKSRQLLENYQIFSNFSGCRYLRRYLVLDTCNFFRNTVHWNDAALVKVILCTYIFAGITFCEFRTRCVKSVQIRSFFWFVFSCIWTEYRKIRTRKNSVFGHFSSSDILNFSTKYNPHEIS